MTDNRYGHTNRKHGLKLIGAKLDPVGEEQSHAERNLAHKVCYCQRERTYDKLEITRNHQPTSMREFSLPLVDVCNQDGIQSDVRDHYNKRVDKHKPAVKLQDCNGRTANFDPLGCCRVELRNFLVD